VLACITISADYTASLNDTYIGITSKKPVKVVLPENPEPGKIYIIKLQVGAPVGNRKVTIIPSGTSKIDGNNSVTLQNPYEGISVIYNDGSWYTF
jgi:hypothetical protein